MESEKQGVVLLERPPKPRPSRRRQIKTGSGSPGEGVDAQAGPSCALAVTRAAFPSAAPANEVAEAPAIGGVDHAWAMRQMAVFMKIALAATRLRRTCTIRIQAAFRMYVARKRFRREREEAYAATEIQRRIRGNQCRTRQIVRALREERNWEKTRQMLVLDEHTRLPPVPGLGAHLEYMQEQVSTLRQELNVKLARTAKKDRLLGRKRMVTTLPPTRFDVQPYLGYKDGWTLPTNSLVVRETPGFGNRPPFRARRLQAIADGDKGASASGVLSQGTTVNAGEGDMSSGGPPRGTSGKKHKTNANLKQQQGTSLNQDPFTVPPPHEPLVPCEWCRGSVCVIYCPRCRLGLCFRCHRHVHAKATKRFHEIVLYENRPEFKLPPEAELRRQRLEAGRTQKKRKKPR